MSQTEGPKTMNTARSRSGSPNGMSTPLRIENTALHLFRKKGYAGSSIREIAAGSDVAIATMFHHFPSKLAILERLLHLAVDELQAELDEAMKDTTDARERLRACVRVMVVAHCLRSTQSFVAESELRSLPEDASHDIRRKRLRIQKLFHKAVEEGIESGEFTCTDAKIASVAILTMCTSVASWYRPGGPLTPEQLAQFYVDFAFSIVHSSQG